MAPIRPQRKKANPRQNQQLQQESVKAVANQRQSTLEPGVIELGDSLTIKTVADVKRRIQQSLKQHQDIVLDSTDLQKIDTAGLQMLYSLQKSLLQSDQTISWKFCNPVIESAAKLIGLEEIYEPR